MTIPTNSLIIFIFSGLVFLLLGGFLGGEVARKRQHKVEIKEILQWLTAILGAGVGFSLAGIITSFK